MQNSKRSLCLIYIALFMTVSLTAFKAKAELVPPGLLDGVICSPATMQIPGSWVCGCDYSCSFVYSADGGVYTVDGLVHVTIGWTPADVISGNYRNTCNDRFNNDIASTPEDENCAGLWGEILARISPTHLSESWGPTVLTCGNTHSYTAVFVLPPTPTPVVPIIIGAAPIVIAE